MSIVRRCGRIALATMLLLTATPLVVFGYTWSNVVPSNNSNNVNCSPLKCGAQVGWVPPEQALTSGTILASPSNYTGQIGYNFAYNAGSNSGVFVSGTQQGQNATITFTPALNSATSVTLTFTAQAQNSGGTTTSTTQTTFSSQ